MPHDHRYAIADDAAVQVLLDKMRSQLRSTLRRITGGSVSYWLTLKF
jgi:hypothetical protein